MPSDEATILHRHLAGAQDVEVRFGRQAALDYLVGEKVPNYLRLAEEDPAFAPELPAFLAAVREAFSREEILAALDRAAAELPREVLVATFAETGAVELSVRDGERVWWVERAESELT